MLAKRRRLALFEFLGGLSKKKGVDFFQEGPEDFLKVISTVDQISHKIKNHNNDNHNVLYLLTIFKCLHFLD